MAKNKVKSLGQNTFSFSTDSLQLFDCFDHYKAFYINFITIHSNLYTKYLHEEILLTIQDFTEAVILGTHVLSLHGVRIPPYLWYE